MHLLVLSAFRLVGYAVGKAAWANGSQCTFWRSVLSDISTYHRNDDGKPGLNAPSGAQCFPTELDKRSTARLIESQCLLVLSAFRRKVKLICWECGWVSMHLLVLNAFRLHVNDWADRLRPVSMHLLVLSAFRLKLLTVLCRKPGCLNASSGAQCFPTRDGRRVGHASGGCLNAPSGAQCFPTT